MLFREESGRDFTNGIYCNRDPHGANRVIVPRRCGINGSFDAGTRPTACWRCVGRRAQVRG